MTNYQIINAINILDDFSEKKLPQKISYAIIRNLSILQKEYECYFISLNKLFNEYKDYTVKNENGEILYNDSGIPIIDSDEKSKELIEETNTLLNINIHIEVYYIPEELFDYEDSSNRYDALSAKDIFVLQSILCNKNDKCDSDCKKNSEVQE